MYRIGLDYPGPLTKSDLQRLLDLIIAEDTGKYVRPDSAATFEKLARQYIAVKEPRWGLHAAGTTNCIIEKHLIGKLDERRVDELNGVEIQMLINDLVKANASHSLLQKTVTHLRAILDQAEELKIIGRNPMRSRMFRSSTGPGKEKRTATLALRSAAASSANSPAAIVRMFIQFGLRPGRARGAAPQRCRRGLRPRRRGIYERAVEGHQDGGIRRQRLRSSRPDG